MTLCVSFFVSNFLKMVGGGRYTSSTKKIMPQANIDNDGEMGRETITAVVEYVFF